MYKQINNTLDFFEGMFAIVAVIALSSATLFAVNVLNPTIGIKSNSSVAGTSTDLENKNFYEFVEFDPNQQVSLSSSGNVVNLSIEPNRIDSGTSTFRLGNVTNNYNRDILLNFNLQTYGGVSPGDLNEKYYIGDDKADSKSLVLKAYDSKEIKIIINSDSPINFPNRVITTVELQKL